MASNSSQTTSSTSSNNEGQSTHTALFLDNFNSPLTPISTPIRNYLDDLDVVQPNGLPFGLANGSTNGLTTPVPQPIKVEDFGELGHLALNMPMPLNAGQASKPRGRPKGSKNKPKCMAFNNDPEHLPKAHVLEIPSGVDIVDMVRHFARGQNGGVTVLSGMGRVKNVTARNSMTPNCSIYHGGVHDLVSLTGFLVGPAFVKAQCDQFGPDTGSYSFDNGAYSNFMVVLNGPNVGIWGGQVVGRLMTAGKVSLQVLTFGNYEFHKSVPRNLDMQPHAHHGAGPSTGGTNFIPDPSLGGGPHVGGGMDKDSNLSGRKRRRE